MNWLDSHDANHADALQRPSFSFQDRLKRLLWVVAWRIVFRSIPVPFHGWRSMVLRWFGAKIGATNFIYPTAKIWAPWLLETADVVTIGPGVEIYNPGGVRLGHHTILSQDSYLCGATHDYQSADFTYVKKAIVTAPYAWICARAMVLPGVMVGEGAVLGAGSVAARNLDAWTVYAGNPAKAVRSRQRSIVEGSGGAANKADAN